MIGTSCHIELLELCLIRWIEYSLIGCPHLPISAHLLRLAPATLLMEDDEGATPLGLLAGTAPFEAGSPDSQMDPGNPGLG